MMNKYQEVANAFDELVSSVSASVNKNEIDVTGYEIMFTALRLVEIATNSTPSDAEPSNGCVKITANLNQIREAEPLPELEEPDEQPAKNKAKQPEPPQEPEVIKVEPANRKGSVITKGNVQEVLAKKRAAAEKAAIPIDCDVPEPIDEDTTAENKHFLVEFKNTLKKARKFAVDNDAICTIWCALRLTMSREDIIAMVRDPELTLENLVHMTWEICNSDCNIDAQLDPFAEIEVLLGEIRAMMGGTYPKQ